MDNYDFSGWATRNNLKCSDGRTILKDAFKHNDGKTVPLVWGHQHDDPFYVLGHALLKNMNDGVYAYCTFNDTESGRNAKMIVEHGDVSGLSIYANQLRQQGTAVTQGNIRELSLVLAGANPGAFIDSVISHEDGADEEAIIYTGEPIALYHSDESDSVMGDDTSETAEEPETKMEESDDAELQHSDTDDKETIADVVNSMSEKQKTALYAIVGHALAHGDENEDSDEGGDDTMKHNVFDTDDKRTTSVLSHSDQEDILKMAKTSSVGTFQQALQIYADENSLKHDAIASGFAQTGDGNITYLFPEYKDVRPGAPELITNDQGWIDLVISKVHKSPISRIRTRYVDIRNINALRAKGYKKGKQKALAGNYNLVQRTTDPQTVYAKSALHRDDIVDITDFDVVGYQYNIDRMTLNEELATAIVLGDGRDVGDVDKISEDHIRPIWTDDDLYTLHVDLDIAKAKTELQGENTKGYFGENYIYAEAMVNTCLYAREKFKGSGTPDMIITPHMLNVMLLARDMNGRRIYSSKAELATVLNVGEIITAEQFEDKTRTVDGKTKKLLAIITNFADYSLGSTKGGEITHFTDFDIDFNQQKSLLETRVSGALTRVYSAIAIEEPADSSDNNETTP